MNLRWILFFASLAAPAVSRAADPVLPFASVWGAVRAASPSQRAAEAGLRAAKTGSERSGRHWLPRVYLDGRIYSTNDALQNFSNLLGERKAAADDFAPATLNHPGSSVFTQGGVGVDLPLFEGGARVAEHEARKKEVTSKSFAARAASSADYLGTASLFGTALALDEQARQLSVLAQSVNATLERYQLGARGNPVGRSGLLGLEGLRNRIEATLAQLREQASGARDSLSEMAGSLPAGWQPARQEFLDFVKEALPRAREGREASFAVKAAQAGAESLETASRAEKAKLLPKVGLFAQENLYNGSRGTGTSYAAGAYVQWSLFSPADYGSGREAELRAAEAGGYAEARASAERAEKARSRRSAAASEETIRLLGENVKLLAEQTETSRRLYQNGSINALQLVEVYSRRADLLDSLTQARLGLLSARVTELQSSDFEVSHDRE